MKNVLLYAIGYGFICWVFWQFRIQHQMNYVLFTGCILVIFTAFILFQSGKIIIKKIFRSNLEGMIYIVIGVVFVYLNTRYDVSMLLSRSVAGFMGLSGIGMCIYGCCKSIKEKLIIAIVGVVFVLYSFYQMGVL